MHLHCIVYMYIGLHVCLHNKKYCRKIVINVHFSPGMCSRTTWSRPRPRPRPEVFEVEAKARSTVILDRRMYAYTRAVLSQGGPRDAAVNFDKKIYNGIARFLCHSTAFL